MLLALSWWAGGLYAQSAVPPSAAPGGVELTPASAGDEAAIDALPPPPTLAALLELIPADTSAALIVPDLGALDAQLAQLQRSAHWPAVSALTLAQAWLELLAGVDADGSAAVLLLPKASGPAAGMPTWPASVQEGTLVLIVPTADRDRLLAPLSPQVEAEGGGWRVELRGRATCAAAAGRFTVLSPTRESVGRVTHCDTSWAARLSAAERDRLSEAAATLTVPAEWLWTPAPAGRGDREPRPPVWVGLQAGATGVTLDVRLPAGTLEPTASATAATATGGAGNLLAGLPADRPALAVGCSGELTRIAALLLGDTPVAPADLRSVERAALSVVRLQQEEGSAWGATLVLRTDQPADLWGRVRTGVASVVQPGGNSAAPAAAEQAAGRGWAFQDAAEQIAGLDVDHIQLAADWSGWDYVSGVRPQATLVRVAAVDDAHLVVVAGGGPQRFEAVVAAVRSGQAPLAAEVGIARLAPRIPAGAALIAYWAADRWWSKPAGEADAGAPPPVLLTVQPAAQQVWRGQVFIPVEMVDAWRVHWVEQLARDWPRQK